MKSARALLAAFAAAALAAALVLARRASKKSGKNIVTSLPDVPGEAQRLASDVKSRATETVADVRTRSAEAVNTSLQSIRQKETAMKERILGGGRVPEAGHEVGEAQVAEAAEAGEAATPTGD